MLLIGALVFLCPDAKNAVFMSIVDSALESKMSVVILIAQRDLCVMKSVCNLTREIRR